MPLIVKEDEHILIRIPIVFFGLVFYTFGPIIISFIGSNLIEYFSGTPCHEGNCAFGSIGWLAIITIPTGIIFSIIFAVIIIIDLVQLFKS